MPPIIAAAIFAFGILGLFLLNLDRKARTSKALWIPVLWLLINGSRPVSSWLPGSPETSSNALDPNHYLDGSPFDRNIFTALLIVALVVLVNRRRRVATLLRANMATVLFFSYCGLSVLWSDYTYVAFKRWDKAVGDVAMVLIVLTDMDPNAALKRLLTRTGFLLLPLSVLFIKYYPDLGRIYDPWTWQWMPVGVTGHKNELGMVCFVIGLGTVWRLFPGYREEAGARRKGPLVAQCALLTMALWLLWSANSMTSLACLLLGSSLMVATSFRALAGRRAAVHLLVAATIFLPVFGLFFDSGVGLIEGLGRNSTLTGRTDIWQGLIVMAVNPFFGAGFESFWLGDRVMQGRNLMWRLNEAHNGYLEVYLNLGWTGVILLALLIATGYRNVVATFRQRPGLGSIMLAYFTVGVIYSLTEAGFRMMTLIWMFFLMAITAFPRAPVPRSLSRRDIEQGVNSVACAPEVDSGRAAEVTELVI